MLWRLEGVLAALSHRFDLIDAHASHELGGWVTADPIGLADTSRVRRSLHDLKATLDPEAAVRLEALLLVLHPLQTLLGARFARHMLLGVLLLGVELAVLS